jgi:primosomal protein N'
VNRNSQQTSSWRVLVALPVGALDYQPVLEWRNQASLVLGRRVLVPWSGGARVGLVVQVLEVASERSLALKESIAVLDEQPILTPEACETLLEVSRVNLSLDGLALQDFVPFGLEPEFDHIARLVPGVNTDGLPDRSEDLLEWANAKDFDPGLLDFALARFARGGGDVGATDPQRDCDCTGRFVAGALAETHGETRQSLSSLT